MNDAFSFKPATAGLLRSSNPFGRENSRPVILYDLQIKDINERRLAKKHYDTVKAAAEFLGLNYRTLLRHMGGRIESLKHPGMLYAVREPKKSDIIPPPEAGGPRNNVFKPLATA